MKKILTISLMAMMVVGAARADIASVGYVDEKLATKANVSDVTSISNKLGTVAEGKTVVEMIADAKQEAIDAAGDATYNDTEVRDLIGDNADAISALETKVGDSSVAAQIDAVRATTIAGLTEEQQQTMFPTVDLTGQMIATSTNDFATSIGDNATAIQNINNSAVMKSGITADKVAAYDAYADAISDNATAAAGAQAAAEAAQGAADAAQDAADANAEAIAAINNSENGFLKQAETAAQSYADGVAATAKSEAIAAANSYADDVAATAKSEAIAAAKSAGDAAYDAKGAAEAAKTAAVAAAKQAADAAYAAKAYETRVQANETAIAANTAAAAAAKSAADAAQADADAAQADADANTQAIDKINIASAQLLTQGAGDGQYALTMTKSGDSLVYKWEMIGR